MNKIDKITFARSASGPGITESRRQILVSVLMLMQCYIQVLRPTFINRLNPCFLSLVVVTQLLRARLGVLLKLLKVLPNG